VLIADREVAIGDGFKPRARFLARVAVGDDPTLQLAGVIPATQKALKRAGLTLADIDWIEINEAFATVVLSWARELNANLEKVNPWGGAIAHGHPLGATGAGLFGKMLNGLEATGGRLGLQTMCIGHGMADHRTDLVNKPQLSCALEPEPAHRAGCCRELWRVRRQIAADAPECSRRSDLGGQQSNSHFAVEIGPCVAKECLRKPQARRPDR
jgi:hypothetical protein